MKAIIKILLFVVLANQIKFRIQYMDY